MTLEEVMSEIKSLGTAQTQKTWMNHGSKGETFGVKMQKNRQGYWYSEGRYEIQPVKFLE